LAGLRNQEVERAAGIAAANRSFDGAKELKRADLAGSKRNSAAAALRVTSLRNN
jgi:hypothetical protein